MLNIKRWLIGLSIMLASPLSGAQTLEALVLGLASNYPKIQGAEAKVRTAREEIEAAEAARYPRVSAQGGVGRGRMIESGKNVPMSTPVIKGVMPLIDFGRVNESVLARTAEADASGLDVHVVRDSVVIELAEAYASAVRDSLAVQVLRSQVAALDELLRKVQAIASIDKGRQSEVVQVVARREQAEQMALYRQSSADRARSRLQAMTGSAVQLVQVMPDVGDWLPVSEADIEPILEWHPRLLSAGQQILAADSRTRLADKAYLPTFSLDVALGTESSFGGVSRSAPQAQISLSGTLDMFDAGGASARARAEAGRAAAVKAERETLYRELLAEALSQWRQLDSRSMRLDVLERQVLSSKKLRDAGFEQFDLGRRSLTDLILFENDYYSAKLAWVEESIDIPATRLRLLASLGRVSHVLLKLAAESQGNTPALAKALWTVKGSN